jgi:hypothetical protein
MKKLLLLAIAAASMFACVPLEPGPYDPYASPYDASPEYYPPVAYEEPVYYPPPIPVSYPYNYFYYVPNGPYVDIVIVDRVGRRHVHHWNENGRRMKADQFHDWQRHHKYRKKDYPHHDKYGKPDHHGQQPVYTDKVDTGGKRKPIPMDKNQYGQPYQQVPPVHMEKVDTGGKRKPVTIDKNKYGKPDSQGQWKNMNNENQGQWKNMNNENQGQWKNMSNDKVDTGGKKKPVTIDRNKYGKPEQQGQPQNFQNTKTKVKKEDLNAPAQMNQNQDIPKEKKKKPSKKIDETVEKVN